MVTFYDVQKELPFECNFEANKVNRGQWQKPIEFLLSCVSMCVGLGNVWRFPYVAYNNGGVGRPLYYLELSLGQFSGKGPIKVWKCVPFLKGVGFAQIITVSYVIIFYNYIMAVTLYYLFMSFNNPLPWSVADESWSSSCYLNITENDFACNTSLSQEYFQNHVLKAPNWFNWRLAGCLTLSWVVVYLCVIKSVASLGKVAYFTALFPYLMLICLLIVSLLREGSTDGILYFFTPDWARMLDPRVWYRALEQCFFSLNICFGAVLMYASYNRFDNNVYRDSMIISVVDTFSSILASCVVFAVLGSMSHELKTPISELVKMQGEELAFIVYPQVLSTVKVVPQLWSVLFFIMLFVLGVGSSVSQVETILTCIREQFPRLMNRKSSIALIALTIFNICGFSLTNNSGRDVLKILNNYGTGSAAFLYGTLQTIGVMWIYGCRRFCSDIKFMSSQFVGLFWRVTWTIVCPFALVVIFIFGTYTEVTAHTEKWIVTMSGWSLAALAVLQIPIWMVITTQSYTGTIKQRLEQSITPSEDWGPSDPSHYYRWKNHRILEKEGTIPLSFITLR
ncbi:Sodium-dependent nutrient amino acid transporter 1-like protein [Leptotrombidium deliense]|uniref:Sodium-dependent nutrient amino acid transporter 1 n=1 Tax=Leptotrombidium deliense TaxID=299467 RepID=A0A443SQW7_9ACAR|nr:Sodium-dependent nutrient amino acid transporter 1-like protein [Leptotrombidium deliense]